MSRFGNGLCGFFLCWVVWYNAWTFTDKLAMPSPLPELGVMLGLDQSWQMFAPAPPKEAGFFIMKGELESGEIVDVWRPGLPFTFDRPSSVPDVFPHDRVMNWFQTLRFRPRFSGPMLDYLHFRWRQSNPHRPLKSISLIYITQAIRPPEEGGYSAPERQHFGSLDCRTGVFVTAPRDEP